MEHAEGQRPVRSGSVRRRRSGAPGQDARRHRIRLALAVHPQPADPSDHAKRCSSFIADLTIVDLPSFRADPEASRRPQRDHHRRQLRQEDRADRRHLLCRRNEEVGLHLSQLRPAAGKASCRCIARPMSATAMTRRSSSACPAPARRRFRPTPRARSSATTSTAGRRKACSISKAAATPRRSSCRARPSRKSSPPPSVSAR